MPAAFQEQLTLLKELQAIDLDLHSLRLKLDALPGRIADKREVFETIDARLAAMKTELEETEKMRRADESELAASTEHLREREAKLYAIKTNKEYQAALKEISEGKRINREREDRILQSMEKIESLKKEIEQLQGEFTEKEAAFKSALGEVESEQSEIHARMQAEAARKPEIEKQLDKESLRKYGTIRSRYPDALVAVIVGICQGCSCRIPPQLFNELLRQKSMRTCPSCQRLIYVGEAPAEEGDAE
jgi:hypothetical protein